MTEPARPAPTPRPDGLPARAGRGRRAAPAPATTQAGGAPGEPTTADREILALARRIVGLAEDKKAADIALLDLRTLTTVADYFVICCGGSERQLDAIADGVIEGLRADGVRPIGREGTAASHWVLIDYGSVIVHVFTPPERDYYQLERHWAEAKVVVRVQ